MAVKTYGRRSHAKCRRCAPRSADRFASRCRSIVAFSRPLGICAYHVYEANEDRRRVGGGRTTLPWKLGRRETRRRTRKSGPEKRRSRCRPSPSTATIPTTSTERSLSGCSNRVTRRSARCGTPNPITCVTTRAPCYRPRSRHPFAQNGRPATALEDVRFVVGNTTVRAEAIVCRVNEYCRQSRKRRQPQLGVLGPNVHVDAVPRRRRVSQSVTFVDLSGDADAFLGVERESDDAVRRAHVLHLRRGVLLQSRRGAGHVRFRSSQLFVDPRQATGSRSSISMLRPARQGHGADARARERHGRCAAATSG